ncbi:MAG TPA: SPOR domain-containing protein [Burkholderiaceae bacterium]|nr:SPOR domain-containing protein [Burkholderiaceae bacterium]
MASTMQPANLSRTLLLFVGGLVAGLAIAAGVAIYLTNVPGPFVNKVQRPTEKVNPTADGKLPDPNTPLFRPTDPAQAPPTVAPPVAPPTAAVAPGTGPTPSATAPAAVPTEGEGTRFALQTGAFRNADDADAMRARLALIGLDARIFPVEQAGERLFRVRLGPYGTLDDVNKIRARLVENGMESQLVRVR